MGYVLYSLTFAVLVVGTLLYFTRSLWQHLLPDISGSRTYLYERLPTTFRGDIEAGLTSDTFNLSRNLVSGDERGGLDDSQKAEILAIMQRRRLPFDKARKVWMEQRFKANGIGADGLPRDPKFVSFS